MVKRKRNLLLSALAMTGLGLTPACSTSPLAGPSGSASPSASAPAKAPAPGWARPIWATSQQLVGTVDRAQTLALQVHLANRNPEALAADIAAVTDPDSPRYRQFLSDEEFAAKYAPTAADVAAVRTHLEANGLRVTYVPNNRAYIAVEGSAAQVESAFATKLGLYQVDGKLRHAPIDQPSLPADLQARVSGVLGLHTPAVVKPHNVRLGGIPRSALKNVKPNASDATVQCSQWFGAKADTTDPAYTGYSQLTYAPCGYRPGQIRAAYGFKDSIRAGNDGAPE